MVSDLQNGFSIPADSATFSAGLTSESVPVTNVITKHVKCIQLDKDNYFSWEAQFSAMLRGFELMRYVEGNVDLSTPAARQQDQLILSWILTGVSMSILPQVVSYKTSAAIWQTLKRMYASSTQSRQLHLSLQL